MVSVGYSVGMEDALAGALLLWEEVDMARGHRRPLSSFGRGAC
jgi:hypothetical protein